MASVLVLASRLPYPLRHGGTLRIFHISRQIAMKHHCVLAALAEDDENRPALEGTEVFDHIDLIPPRPARNPASRRHLRLSERHICRLSYPRYYRFVVSRLSELIQEHQPDIVLCFFAPESEFILPFNGAKRIVDDCDSQTLALERRISLQHAREPIKRLASRLYLSRVKAAEKRLAEDFDLVTTVSPADRERLVTLSPGHSERIVVAPNGVAPELLEDRGSSEEIPNAVIFWGNMGFPPNRSAVFFFYRQVYMPFLAARGIVWYIAGGSADDDIVKLGNAHRNIIVTGFVEDLHGLASRIPVMVNPMVIGGGLKNKVLEAFALERAVVSTPMGMEAIVGAEDGVHYMAARTPENFARIVFECLNDRRLRREMGAQARGLVESRYTWDTVGRSWHRWIDRLMENA